MLQDMYLAGNEAYKGNIGDARRRIRNVVRNIPEHKRDIVYSYASQIYLEAGVSDSAYMFACKLIESKNNDHRKIGYSLLLNPELRRFSSIDSLISYSLIYRELLDEYLDRHDAQQVITQTSLYNYQTHERKRKKAEDAKRIYMSVAVGTIFIVLLLCIVIIYIRNRSMRILLKYRRALEDMALLKKAIFVSKEKGLHIQECAQENDAQFEQTMENQSNDEDNVQISKENGETVRLREQLKAELLTLQRAGEARKDVAESILLSSVYGRIQKHLESEKQIPDSDGLWCELEDEVLKVSAEFKSRLYLLTGDKLKGDAYHMALLIKCGITPTELTVLVGRSKGAVSSRRGYICEMIFGEKLGAKVMDDIIRLL